MLRSAGVATLAAIVLAAGCSKRDGPSILGHWRAERVQVYSAYVPIGPDIVIKDDEISSPDADASMPVKAIERKGDEAVLDFAYGMGLSFYFDSPDRIYIKVPLVGRIYYRRVADASAAQPQAAAAASGAALPAFVAPPTAPGIRTADYRTLVQEAEQSMRDGSAEQAQALLTQAEQYQPAHPTVDYDLARLAARSANLDLAIDHLNEAFKRGFRQFDLLDSTRDFDALKSDVRYQALVARYR